MTDLTATAQLEVDDSGTSRQFSVDDLKPAQTGAASEASLVAGLGGDGSSPPTITGTGVRGWLRAIYEKLAGTLTVTGPATNAQLRATPLPVTGTVTATVDETTLTKDATLTSGDQKTQVTNFPATQPVSGTVAVSNPTTNPETGLAKDATLTTLVGGPGSGVATITGSGSGIQGLLRMIWDALRGSIAVTGTFWQATQPVSLASTVVVDTAGGRTIKFAKIDAASSGNNTLIAAVAGKKITVLSYSLIADAAVTAAFQDGASGTALSGAMSLAANGGVSAAVGGLPILQVSTNTLLNLSLGGAVGVRGHITYYEA